MGKKLECPSCGRMSMTLKKGTLKTADGVRIPNIKRWVCEYCEEELFDFKTMKEIREHRMRHAKAA